MRKGSKFLLGSLFIIAVFVFAYYLRQYVADSERLQDIIAQYGYGGLFLVAFGNGFNVLVPFPTLSLLPALLEAGLNVSIIILIVTTGATLADIIGFAVGVAGREVLAQKFGRTIRRLDALREKDYWLPLIALFLFATFAPLPNEFMVVPLGFLEYRARHVFIATFLGNLLFNILYAIGIIELFKTV